MLDTWSDPLNYYKRDDFAYRLEQGDRSEVAAWSSGLIGFG